MTQANPYNIFTCMSPPLQEGDCTDAAGDEPGPLAGISLILKDNINTADMPTSGGTPALQNNVPSQDAPIVCRLRRAGAAIVGKGNLHELSSGGTSNNATFGAVQNPHDPACVPGGSSGGVAAAVAAGITRAGIGTDTAGSVRAPAALCGVVGFRPTTGRYPGAGIVPLTTSYDTAGPISLTVADTALLDSVLADIPNDVQEVELDQVRFGVPRAALLSASDSVRPVFEKALQRIESAGVVLVDVDLDEIVKLGAQASMTIMEEEFVPVMRDYLAEHAADVSLEVLADQIASPTVKKIVQRRLASNPDRAKLNEAVDLLTPKLKQLHQDLFKAHNIDALLFPTSPETALPRDTDDKVFLNGESVYAWFYFMNTSLASFAGNPSISIPAGVTGAGLPVGLCLDGLPGSDRRLLGVAAAVEQHIQAG